MSVRAMAAVWAIELADSQKIVLLALADCANDEGLCWPSMATLTKKCSKSERTIQGVIKELVAEGHLTRTEVPGKGCKYTVHPRSGCAPADVAPAQGATQTPAAAADKPSRTITNGLADAKPKRARRAPAVRSHRMPEDWVPGPLPADVADLVAQWPPGRLEREAAATRDYWLTRQTKRPGWDLTFHNRIRDVHDRVLREASYGQQPQRNAAPGDRRDGIARALDRRLGLDETPGPPGRPNLGAGEGDSFRPVARLVAQR